MKCKVFFFPDLNCSYLIDGDYIGHESLACSVLNSNGFEAAYLPGYST